MISNLRAVRNRLIGWLGLTLLAFIAAVALGQGVAFANVLTPVAQPVGLNLNPKAQNPFEPELIPALAALAQPLMEAAPVTPMTAAPDRNTSRRWGIPSFSAPTTAPTGTSCGAPSRPTPAPNWSPT